MLYDSLNVTIDPEAKKDFMDGKINVFKCNNCNAEIFVQKALLYHDMSQHFCAYFIPYDAVFNDNFIKTHISSDGEMNHEVMDFVKSNPDFEYFMDPHIVLSMDELIRYVIFRDRIAQVYSKPEESELP